MNNESTEFRCLFADDPGCDGIDRTRSGLVALSFVHRSVGGGVDDDIWAKLANSGPQGLGIGVGTRVQVRFTSLASNQFALT